MPEPRSRQNLYGQAIGAKGASTYRRILRATAGMMERRSIRELKVNEIGARAGVSAATFYVYFESVPDAAHAVVEQLNQATPEVMCVLEREWSRADVLANARDLVQAYVAYWDEHHVLLRIRNFMADEGDRRFAEARRRAVDPVHIGLQEKIRRFQATDESAPPLDPASTATVLMAMLERVSAIIRNPSGHGATRPRQIESAAYLIASAMIALEPDMTTTKRAAKGARLGALRAGGTG